jgi:hypothetical protein
MEQSMLVTSDGTAVARHRERSLATGLRGPRLGYCQRTPADMLACDHG